MVWCLIKHRDNFTFTVQEVKWLGREANHLSPCSAEIKNAWNYTSTPPYVFMAVKCKGNLIFTSVGFYIRLHMAWCLNTDKLSWCGTSRGKLMFTLVVFFLQMWK
jgi:hypothetical protein